VIGREELLAAREDEPHGPVGGPGERGDVGLVVELALAAEPAAQVRDDDADVALGDLEGGRDARACDVRHLGGRPHRHSVALPLRDRGVRLDRDGVGHVGDVALLHDGVGRRQRRVDVALHDRRAGGVVALADDIVGGRVIGPALVDEGGAVLQCGLDVAHDRQLLVLDVDQRRRLARDLRRGGGDRGDDLALVTDDVAGEQRTVLDEGAVADVGHVLVGHHAEDARQRARPGRVDRADAGVRMVGVAEARVQHPGHREVGGVAAEPRHLVLAVRPDELRLCRCGHVASPPPVGNCV
jgi:hypothetical protein